MADSLRLVVAEDSLLVRGGLVSLLATAEDLIPTTACSSLDELYEAVERDNPDVVVTDIRMPPPSRVLYRRISGATVRRREAVGAKQTRQWTQQRSVHSFRHQRTREM